MWWWLFGIVIILVVILVVVIAIIVVDLMMVDISIVIMSIIILCDLSDSGYDCDHYDFYAYSHHHYNQHCYHFNYHAGTDTLSLFTPSYSCNCDTYNLPVTIGSITIIIVDDDASIIIQLDPISTLIILP